MTDPPSLNFAAWVKDAQARLEARPARSTMRPEVREWAQRQLAKGFPPLSQATKDKLAALFSGNPDPNPRPEKEPRPPGNGGRTVDPAAGTLYGTHLRASPGDCQRCRENGPREVDHCHKHHVVRGPLCGKCNKLAERNLGDDWRKNCLWCAWDIWLEKELAR